MIHYACIKILCFFVNAFTCSCVCPRCLFVLISLPAIEQGQYLYDLMVHWSLCYLIHLLVHQRHNYAWQSVHCDDLSAVIIMDHQDRESIERERRGKLNKKDIPLCTTKTTLSNHLIEHCSTCTCTMDGYMFVNFVDCMHSWGWAYMYVIIDLSKLQIFKYYQLYSISRLPVLLLQCSVVSLDCTPPL